MAVEYHFDMSWRFDVPIADAWRMLNSATEWPKWWRNCQKVEQLQGADASGVGGVQRFSMQTQLPYQLQFDIRGTRSEPPRLLEGSVEGNLKGTVRWQLTEVGDGTSVHYNWDVAPTKPWMAALSPLLRPVFVWNHRAMMRNGGQGLARMMGARLLAAVYR